jgi:uncharacterized protein YdaU (DUF1376 family)
MRRKWKASTFAPNVAKMPKRLWMPLYVGDYLAKTSHLTMEQHGAYLLLLMHYWANGSLPQDCGQLVAIARCSDEWWAGNCKILAQFFDNRWRNKRMEKELSKAKTISDKRSLAGLKGGWKKHNSYSGHILQMPPQSQSHIRKRVDDEKG